MAYRSSSIHLIDKVLIDAIQDGQYRNISTKKYEIKTNILNNISNSEKSIKISIKNKIKNLYKDYEQKSISESLNNYILLNNSTILSKCNFNEDFENKSIFNLIPIENGNKKSPKNLNVNKASNTFKANDVEFITYKNTLLLRNISLPKVNEVPFKGFGKRIPSSKELFNKIDNPYKSSIFNKTFNVSSNDFKEEKNNTVNLKDNMQKEKMEDGFLEKTKNNTNKYYLKFDSNIKGFNGRFNKSDIIEKQKLDDKITNKTLRSLIFNKNKVKVFDDNTYKNIPGGITFCKSKLHREVNNNSNLSRISMRSASVPYNNIFTNKKFIIVSQE